MKRCLAGIVIVFLFAPPAGAQTCAAYATPIRVGFETPTPTVAYNNSLNVTGIRSLFQTRGMPVSGPHTQALGVTYVTPAFALEARTRAARVGEKEVCVYMDEVRAKFSLRDVEVYIASEYPVGSCEYNAIKDHENQHVAINIRLLKEYAPRVRAALERLLASEQPVHAARAETVTKAKIDDLSRRMGPILDEFQKVLAQRNAVIDTPSNYQAISDICGEWNRGNVWPQAAPSAKSRRY